jgi:competence protein ComEC
MTLIYLCLSWLAGIVLGSLQRVDIRIVGLLCLLPLAVAFLWRRQPAVRLAALSLLLVGAGMIRYETALPPPDYGSIALNVGPRPVDVGGVVSAEPDIRGTDIILVVSAYHVGSGQDSYAVNGGVQVRVPRYTVYAYGDDLLLHGVLQDPPEYDDFSYKQYLARQGIYAIMFYPDVTVVARDQGNQFLASLYAFKTRLLAALQVYIPEPEAGLVEGILLGVKAVMTEELKQDLASSGLTHIVVVSGYNLTVVAALLLALTQKRLRRSLAMGVAMAGIIVFTLMSGATAPVVRAAVMVSMALIAQSVGRESDALTSLLFTAALLIGIDPQILWDVGFQLSFLATAGLVVLSPGLERPLQRLPLGMGAILATSIAAALMTAPVIAFNFHRVSLISPLANLLVQPAIPEIMVFGAITAAAGLTGFIGVRLFGWASWLFSAYVTNVIHFAGGLPRASIDVPIVPDDLQPVVAAVYFALLALLLYVPTHVSRKDWAALRRRLARRGPDAGGGPEATA